VQVEPQINGSKYRNRYPKLPRVAPEGRLCCACRQRKPDSEFRKDQRTKDGIAYRCRDCAYEIEKKWRKNNIERARDNARGVQRRAYAKDPEKYRDMLRRSRMRTIHGLEYEDFLAMLAAQNWQCKICAKHLTVRVRNYPRKGNVACVDHNHETDEIRGILCNHCNRGLGLFGDNAETLITAAEYLRR
jgi:hypothetical protein